MFVGGIGLVLLAAVLLRVTRRFGWGRIGYTTGVVMVLVGLGGFTLGSLAGLEPSYGAEGVVESGKLVNIDGGRFVPRDSIDGHFYVRSEDSNSVTKKRIQARVPVKFVAIAHNESPRYEITGKRETDWFLGFGSENMRMNPVVISYTFYVPTK